MRASITLTIGLLLGFLTGLGGSAIAGYWVKDTAKGYDDMPECPTGTEPEFAGIVHTTLGWEPFYYCHLTGISNEPVQEFDSRDSMTKEEAEA